MVVFFQMLGLLSFVIMWWRNEECGRRDTTCDMIESIAATTITTTTPLQSTGNDLPN
jgi:hypothetical protein